ncbi:cellulose biosynthesis protein BcsG [Vibrio sp. RC27]
MSTPSELISHNFKKLNIDIKWWNVYFVIKFYLFFTDLIDFNLIYNIAFFLLIILLPQILSNRFLQKLILGFIACCLLYFDSFLPPFTSLINQLESVLQFDTLYLLDLIQRFVDIKVFIGFLALCVVYNFIRHYLRITVIVLLTICYISLIQLTSSSIQNNSIKNNLSENTLSLDETLSSYRDNFFDNQKLKQTHLVADSNSVAPFDMLFISICSLSWDDLKLAQLSEHPLFQRFDITFTNYNSATSYSGPAVVRLLRAGCGQPSHSTLFDEANSQACYLFENLSKLGFDTSITMNHNGVFDNFTQLIGEAGHMTNITTEYNTLDRYQVAFDGSPIKRDLDVLDQVLKKSDSDVTNSVTLYNTISLHDGNRIVNSDNSTSIVSYKRRLNNLLSDLDTIYQQIEDSGRNITVVFIPEHGSGLRGDKIQVSGIRDIPAPAIINIPVGVTFFGANLNKQDSRIQIDAPSSHLALGQLTTNIIDSNTYGARHLDLDLLTANLPSTPIVAQNAGVTMMMKDDKSYITLDERTWNEYPTNE